MADVQKLDITVDFTHLNEGIFQILKHIRPTWKHDEVVIETLQGGCVNQMAYCHQRSDDKIKDGIVVRLHADADTEVMDRHMEVIGAQIGHHQGVSPKVYGVFKNGYYCSFVHGRKLGYDDVTNPHMIRKMACMCARLNSADFKNLKGYNMEGQYTTLPSQERVFYNTEYLQKAFPVHLEDSERNKRMKENLPSKEEWLAEVTKVKAKLDSLKLPTVFTHGDMNPHNFLYDEEKDELTVVDYDMVGHDILGQDLAYILLVASFLFHATGCKGTPFDDSHKKLYCQCYLEELFRSHGEDASKITEERLDSFISLIDALLKVQQFRMATFMFSQVNKGTIKVIDCFEIAIQTYNGWTTVRDAFFNYVCDIDWLPSCH